MHINKQITRKTDFNFIYLFVQTIHFRPILQTKSSFFALLSELEITLCKCGRKPLDISTTDTKFLSSNIILRILQ